jgi:ATP-dependent helicase/nuclease subunit B
VRLAAVPFNTSVLDCIAREWLEQEGDGLGGGLILLPTRRAARALAEAFLRAGEGRPLLLPRITAIGGLDEAPLALRGALELPPAVGGMQRLAALSRLILALPEGDGGVGSVDRAWALARELAVLMDEAEREELDLGEALARAAEAEHAAHWQATLDFMHIVTRAWPAWLAGQGLMNPAARQVALVRAQAEAWAAAGAGYPVWTVGLAGGLPSTARLLRVIAGMDHGRVMLAGLDLGMDEETWEALETGHPQAGMRALLAGMGARRGDVAAMGCARTAPDARVAMLGRALLPARALGDWRRGGDGNGGPGEGALAGLFRLETADQQEEAVAIAMILRDAVQVAGKRAALVTPDRDLAGRVSAELLRWGVLADDSAGEALGETPPAVFLRLLAAAWADGFGPVRLLAVLKHPLAGAGLATVACRAAARELERGALRGPRPQAGLVGLRRAGEAAGVAPEAAELVGRVEGCVAPLLRVAAAAEMAPAEMLAALIEAAEALAATDTVGGAERIWAGEEGQALSALLAEALEALEMLPARPPAELPGLLEALLEGGRVRGRRVLRGREGAAEHPRVFIWGLLEAQLQGVDTVVLGGLAEGVWPPATDPGPWMSRPMRTRAGLPSPEEAVGFAAHDFMANACAAPVAVLSCPRRRDGAPAVPARWLARVDAFLAGHGMALPKHPAGDWAAGLDQPVSLQRVEPPAPRPAVRLRPRRLSVTEIETWLADPYAIYAKHVLKLRRLDPLEMATDAADYGRLVHEGLHRFLRAHGAAWPAGAEGRLREAMDHALEAAGLRRALAEWWRPRLYRIAGWVAEIERDRRSAHAPVAIASEVEGRWEVSVPGGFVLTGRADRIELRADGRLAILDYKTGAPPSQKEVEAGFAPQLPLEAAMAASGAFKGVAAGVAAELTYWHLTGGFAAGAPRTLFKGDAAAVAEAAAEAERRLKGLVAAFDDEGRAYLSQPHAGRVPRFSDYAQLARVAEWDLSEEGE